MRHDAPAPISYRLFGQSILRLLDEGVGMHKICTKRQIKPLCVLWAVGLLKEGTSWIELAVLFLRPEPLYKALARSFYLYYPLNQPMDSQVKVLWDAIDKALVAGLREGWTCIMNRSSQSFAHQLVYFLGWFPEGVSLWDYNSQCTLYTYNAPTVFT